MNLLELIICTECKTRVEYHDGSDGYMSCECWVRSHKGEPMPDKWINIEDTLINECGGCRQNINERLVFRCADCGLPFHQTCLDQHCKHGNQKQELRSENLFLKQQVKNLEEYMLKGVAFRDELQARVGELECQKTALQQVNAEAEEKLVSDRGCEVCAGGCPDKDHHVTHRLCDECWDHAHIRPIRYMQDQLAEKKWG